MRVSVFTAAFGEHYDVAPPAEPEDGVRYVAYTGSEKPRVGPGWEQIELTPPHPQGARWANRNVKLFSEGAADALVYIDANVEILSPIVPLVEECLSRGDVSLFRHPDRKTAVDELEECLALGKIDRDTYARVMPEAQQCDTGLWQATVIIRRAGDDLCREWFADMERLGCVRDQPVLPITLKRTGRKVNTIQADMRNNPWFGWGRWRGGIKLSEDEFARRYRA